MKSIAEILAGLVFFLLTSTVGFSQENYDLDTPEKQNMVFNQILDSDNLLEKFISKLQSDPEAKKYTISKLKIECCADSINLREMSIKITENNDILEKLGKDLLEKEQTDFTVKPRPRYKHK